MPCTHYEILGVEPTASAEEIKRAFRVQAKATHPDHHPDDPTAADRFKAVSEAYSVLSDAEARARYDEAPAPEPEAPDPPPPSPSVRPPPPPGQPWATPPPPRSAPPPSTKWSWGDSACMDCGASASGLPRCRSCQRAYDQRAAYTAARAHQARRSMPLARPAPTFRPDDTLESLFGHLGYWGRDGLPRW